MALDRNWRESRREEENDGRCSKAGAKTEYAMTTSVTEEANTPSAGDNRACSNGRSGEDKCSSVKRARDKTGNGGFSKTELLCYGDR